ncbi:hypothetical protein [Aurantimonas sp. 22II-16-19i]|uniref:hypothetical protein n=1 Tax=Aurantimonas sp. 22II-16-19i TaxID=1317114 RepID=UPI001AED1026|nr:hypothetical protein [Aurantimonas sp. 22II-16-19i]
MIARTVKIVSFALILGAAPSTTMAQENNSQESFEVSSLRLSSLPIPTSRATALDTLDDASQDASQDAAPAAEIRRTASGIRIVGPVYFPDERG